MKILDWVWNALTTGTKPLDWIGLSVEVLVLAAILYFEIPDVLERRRHARIRRALYSLLERGLAVQAATPDTSVKVEDSVWEWTHQVEAWTQETRRTIETFSSRAAAAFMLITNLAVADRVVRRPDGSVFHISGHFGNIYQQLQVRIMNLRAIIENPAAIGD